MLSFWCQLEFPVSVGSRKESPVPHLEPRALPIETTPPLDWLRPYCVEAGYRVGDLVILSGQASIDWEGNIVGGGDFDAQVEQIFKNLDLLLNAAQSSLNNVIKVTAYLTEIEHFPRYIELRKGYFTSPYPADTALVVKSLAMPDLLVEMDVIAVAKAT